MKSFFDNRFFKCAITMVVFLFCFVITEVSAQKVLKKGVLKITFTERSAQFSGAELVVPKLEDDEGVLVFTVNDEARKYVKEEDVLDWIRSNTLSIDGLLFDASNARIKGNQVRLRFNYDFLGSEDATSKRLKIDSETFTFNEVLNYYKQQVVFYDISVKDAPQYDRDIFGTLQVFARDGDGATIVIEAEKTKNQRKSIVKAGVATFTDLEEDTYTVSVTKSGFQNETTSAIVIPGQPAAVTINLKRQTVQLTINVNISDYDLLIVDQSGQSINRLNQPSSVSLSLVPDVYTIRISKTGYKDASRQVRLNAGSSGETVRVSLESSQAITSTTKSSNTFWYILLIGAAGGAAYYFTMGSGGNSGSGSYGSPPALPIPLNR